MIGLGEDCLAWRIRTASFPPPRTNTMTQIYKNASRTVSQALLPFTLSMMSMKQKPRGNMVTHYIRDSSFTSTMNLIMRQNNQA